MQICKLVTQDLKTRKGESNETQWKVGEFQKELSGDGNLCGPGWYHYYYDPLLAVLFNPIHASIEKPRLYEVEALGHHKDDKGIKGGCTRMRLVKEIPIPKISHIQSIAFGILCAKIVYADKAWNSWADNWLNGTNRTAANAYAATDAHPFDLIKLVHKAMEY